LKEAYKLFETAGELIDRIRLERGSVGGKLELISGYRSSANRTRMVLCEILDSQEPRGGWKEAAFRTAEQIRARVFLEDLAHNRAPVVGELPSALAKRERELKNDSTRLASAMEAMEAAPFDARDPARMASLQTAAAKAAKEFDEVEVTIARDYPRVASLRRAQPCTLSEARACIRPDEVAVVYSSGPATSTAIVLYPPGEREADGGVVLVRLPGTRALARAVAALGNSTTLNQADLYRPHCRSLHDQLVEPLEKAIGDRQLLIVPDGILGGLAFEMLMDRAGKHLIETRRVRYAPSLTALHLNRLWDKKRIRPTRPILAVGDPIYSTADPRIAKEDRTAWERAGGPDEVAFDRLKFADEETQAVAQALKAAEEDIWTGAKAVRSRLVAASAAQRLAEYRYLHFATHGLLGSGPGRLPALVLSREPSSAGRDSGQLTLADVVDLRLNADLVVLSACRTGQGELRSGEGASSLARGFLNAGALGVVCSLWTVDDEETARAMVELYGNLKGGGHSVDDALREVKLRMIRDGLEPYLWAPFVYLGN
jgi:CHAT domain-containing protein